MIAWMNSWDSLMIPEDTGFAGQMTTPRELSAVNGYLCQTPVRKLTARRTNPVREHLSLWTFRGAVPMSELKGRAMDLCLVLSESAYRYFTVYLAEYGDRALRILYDREKNLLYVDRSEVTLPGDQFPVRYVRLPAHGDRLDLRILLDVYSMEVFACGGRVVLSEIYSAPEEAVGVSLETDGCTDVALEADEISRWREGD